MTPKLPTSLDMTKGRYAVYRLFDEAGILIYIGRSDNLDRRLNAHRTQSPWWSEVAEMEMDFYATYGAAFNVERREIIEKNPVYNKHRWEPFDEEPPAPPRLVREPAVRTLVSTGQAARELDVTSTTVQRWVHKYGIKPAFVTGGGHMRWDLDDLKRQLRELRGSSG